jgi:hypothetical protein
MDRDRYGHYNGYYHRVLVSEEEENSSINDTITREKKAERKMEKRTIHRLTRKKDRLL